MIPDFTPPTRPAGDIPEQMRFELMVDDPRAAVSALQGMGAMRAEYQRPDGGVRVMLDRAGHPFCLATAADATPVLLDEASRQQR